MEYRLRITFAELGRNESLIDRLLTDLLATMPAAGPVISRDSTSGEMAITVAVESAWPTWSAHDFSRRLDGALTRVCAPKERSVLDVHLEAALDDYGIADFSRPVLQSG